MKLQLKFLFILMFGVTALMAQNDNDIKIYYPDNVNANLTKQEKAFIKEVYKSKANDIVFNDENFLKEIKHLLRNRIKVYEDVNAKTQKKAKLLSQVNLNTEFNKKLKRDLKFNLETFNPLKYKLDFFAKGTYVYRVDNTNYFIQVTSQYRWTVPSK